MQMSCNAQGKLTGEQNSVNKEQHVCLWVISLSYSNQVKASSIAPLMTANPTPVALFSPGPLGTSSKLAAQRPMRYCGPGHQCPAGTLQPGVTSPNLGQPVIDQLVALLVLIAHEGQSLQVLPAAQLQGALHALPNALKVDACGGIPVQPPAPWGAWGRGAGPGFGKADRSSQ
ncbi:hypothetical protein HaLaN_12357 [Haematococcus lacustris]|uniref:Uncharacterized protein n=1 Tax=Haematococcus lacustris TaxID=44745 RepID=A0A699Z0F6_HAELA|nr:hypothetical protein HaLaN_12357 [Haematococcus lacustris]